MRNVGFVVLAIVFGSVGCRWAEWDEVDAREEVSPFADATFRPLGEFDVDGSEFYKGQHDAAVAARIELLDSVMDRVDRIRVVLDSDAGWDVKQRRVIEIMKAPDVSAPEAWFVDQLGSSLVLERLTSPDQEHRHSANEQTAAAHFLRVLVGRRSPNAPLIADALEVAQGLLAPVELRSIAITAARHSGEYVETCESCPRSASKSGLTVGAREARLIAEGRLRLLQLANPVDAILREPHGGREP